MPLLFIATLEGRKEITGKMRKGMGLEIVMSQISTSNIFRRYFVLSYSIVFQ